MEKKRPFLKSLRGKISLRMLLVSLLPIILVGGLAYSSLASSSQRANDSVDTARTQMEQDVIGANLTGQASSMMTKMDTYAAERVNDLKSWAIAPTVQQAVVSSSTLNPDADAYLKAQAALNTVLANVYVTNAQGTVVARGSDYVESNQSGNSWWSSAWSDGLNTSHTVWDKENGLFMLYIASRIQDSAGQPVGVIGGTMILPPANVAPVFASYVSGSKVLILDSEGHLLADSSNPERAKLAITDWTDAELQMVADATATENPSGFLLTSDVAIGYSRSDPTAVNSTYGTTGFTGVGWVMLLQQPTSIALAPLDGLQTMQTDLDHSSQNVALTLGIVALVVIAGALATAILLTRSITRPVAKLRDVADKVSMGDMSTTVAVESDDEIGDLAEAFGRMVTAVRFFASESEDKEA
ncbi:MAG: HAMP domain-containing protein [Chloroflexi bacterium]|nr:HAMP domain-containing protein [Chloroflexota bacterium]